VISEAIAEVRPREATRALTTRYLDFWLLGGASIVVWAFMFACNPLRRVSWAVDHHYGNAFAISNTVALFVNYPHFMASYALAYRKGWSFIREHWLQLVAVPIALAVIVTWAYFLFDSSTASSAAIAAANGFFQKVGMRTRFGLSPFLGTEVLGLAVTTMYLTVGWHYTKQVYGCMMVYASFDAYPLTLAQRTLVKWNLFGIWFLSFTYYNVGTEPADFFGLRYFRLGLPHAVVELSIAFLAPSFGAVVYYVFGRVYEQHKRLPSLNMIVPYVAMYLWWVPLFIQSEFYMYVVPFFHSLQYLPFVYKIERGRDRDIAPTRHERRGTLMMIGLVVAGFAFFELVPNTADALLYTKETMSLWYFFIAAQVFINVHHYFIDNVLWRFKNPEVKKYLLA
jgi:hypothetical protein